MLTAKCSAGKPESLRKTGRTLFALITFGLLTIALPASLFSSAAVFPSDAAISTDTDYYSKGMEQLRSGNIGAAIDTWETGKSVMTEADYRIGQAYLALVTEEKMTEKYRSASEIYLWGLEDESIGENRNALLEEVEYLKPIVGSGRYVEYRRKAEGADASLMGDLRRFWKRMDPTPLTDYNERLIEHWNRISHSKEQFSTPSGEEVDARAAIYIRYGEPYYVKKDQLMFNSGLVNMLLTERFGGMTTMDQSSTAGMVRSDQRFNLESAVRQMHTNPYYEVWIYRDLTEKPQNTIFLFGSENGATKFKKMNAVDDFIPSEAFRVYEDFSVSSISQAQQNMMNQGNSGESNQGQTLQFSDYNEAMEDAPPRLTVTPALLFQMMYYQQLSALDAYFGETYGRMHSRYANRNMPISTSLARQFQSTNRGKLIEIERRAPDEQSTYLTRLPELPLQYHIYRFIDEDNEPYFRMFLNSDPQDAGYYDQISNGQVPDANRWTKYQLTNGVLLLDSQGRTVADERRQVTLTPYRYSDILTEFEIAADASDLTMVIGSQLERPEEKADSLIRNDSAFDRSVKAVAREEITPPEALPTDRLALSDIVIGYSGGDSTAEGQFVPFSVSHDRIIPQGENLFLYYELYNLDLSGDDRARFTFSYEIKAKREGLAALFGKKDTGVNITLNNESISGTHRQELEIVTAEFEPGSYQLSVTVEDLNSGGTVERTVDLVIQPR